MNIDSPTSTVAKREDILYVLGDTPAQVVAAIIPEIYESFEIIQ